MEKRYFHNKRIEKHEKNEKRQIIARAYAGWISRKNCLNFERNKYT